MTQPNPPTLFQRPINSVPLAFDIGLGAETAQAYPEQLHGLIAGVAGCSSYLRGLLQTHSDWLNGVLDTPLRTILDGILQSADAGDPRLDLRLAKQRIGLVLALADCAQTAALEEVTEALTEFSDRAVQIAIDAAAGQLFGTGACAGDLGLVVLAMGKTGSGELNYSSDIDLICFFDDANYDADSVFDARAKRIKLVQSAMRILSDRQGDGYVFRTDLRLRPNPSVTPVCSSLSSARRYYAQDGRTWERAAFIKARACAGDIAAGAAFLEEQSGFVYRNHLNFSAKRDIEDIQNRIAEHKNQDKPLKLDGHDIKLGIGGIRAIEFFAQTRQLIAGGREPALRVKSTVNALAKLAEFGWIDADDAKVLADHYRAHRMIEHRLQMLQDAQRHSLPNTPDAWDQFARFCGQADTAVFQRDLLARLQDVAHITTQKAKPVTGDQTGDQTIVQPSAPQAERIAEWRNLPAFKSDAAEEIFAQLQPQFLTHLNLARDPDGMLNNLDLFFSNLSSGVELFSLFQARVDVLLLVMDLCALSPNFAHALAGQTKVLDGLAFDSFFTVLPDVLQYEEMLDHALQGEEDYENQLIKTRFWQAEQLFRIKVQQLRGAVPVTRAQNAYSDLAQAVLRRVLNFAQDDFARRFGHVPDASVVALSMGKLGSREMTCTSDLDLIMVYQGAADAVSDGKTALDIRTYFSRLTRHMITAISSPMSGGRLYEVDMRLRPSGRKGPVATSFESFVDYQTDKAWVWEHLALSRARVVAGDAGLADQVHAVQTGIVTQRLAPVKLRADLQEMRDRIAKLPTKSPDAWGVKQTLGGILDIELFAQSLCLLGGTANRAPRDQIRAAVADGLIAKEAAETLCAAHGFLVDIEHLKRLLFDTGFSAAKLSGGAQQLFLRETGLQNIAAVQQALGAQIATARGVIERCLSELG